MVLFWFKRLFFVFPRGGALGGHFCPFSHRNFGISVEVSKAIKDHWGRLIPVGAGKVSSLRISFTHTNTQFIDEHMSH